MNLNIENIINEVYRIHDIDVNQKYGDDKPYSYHLNMVVEISKKYCPSIFNKEEIVIIASMHDLIEDARFSYTDIIKFIEDRSNVFNGVEIAEAVFCLTDEKGRNRKEKHNQKYWNELLSNPKASFVKCCDRLANIQYSIQTKHSLLNAYKKEHKIFLEQFKTNRKVFNICKDVLTEIDTLLYD